MKSRCERGGLKGHDSKQNGVEIKKNSGLPVDRGWSWIILIGMNFLYSWCFLIINKLLFIVVRYTSSKQCNLHANRSVTQLRAAKTKLI